MLRKASPSTPASSSPASASSTSAPKTSEVSAAPVKTERYYRIRKISGFLSELVAVDVDESVTKPVVVGKQDLPSILMGKIEDHILGKKK